MTAAVEKMLIFSTELRKDWAFWSELFCRSATTFVDTAWCLQMACVTHPGCLASKIKDLECLTSKDKLLAKPTIPKVIRDFLVAELLEANNLRPSAIAVPVGLASTLVADLNFAISDDEGVATSPANVVDEAKLAALTAAVRRLTNFNVNKRKFVGDDDNSLKLAAFQELYDALVNAYKALPPAAADSIISFDALKALGKATKRKAKGLA